MRINRSLLNVLLGISLLATALFGLARRQKEESPAETAANVPALDSFHEVIFKIWHEAWPKKDAAMLRKLLPDVEKGISEVAGARLPGILREKQAAWEEQVKKLKALGLAYRAAADAKDDPNLLDAAEKLHSQYEALVRAVRPALKEIDDFHAVLYMLYHYYVPENRMDRIKSSAAELKQKMVALNEAKLPGRLKGKEAAFVAARAKLSTSVDAFEVAAASDDETKIKQAISMLHSDYQRLSEVFE